MKYLSGILYFGLLFFGLPGYAQRGSKPELSISNIPEELKAGADAVFRLSETTQEIFSGKKVVFHKRYVVTVLNKHGKGYGYFVERYDKSSRISHMTGVVYDAEGKRLKKVLGPDLEDYSAVGRGTLYQDDRVKFYIPDVMKYPYTVEYEYEVAYDGMISYPDWRPQRNYRISVEKAVLKIVADAQNKPRFRCTNIDEPETGEQKGRVVFKWSVSDLKPLKDEPFSGPVTDRMPVVYLAPGPFTYAKTQGDMSTWSGFGNWIGSLNSGRQDLPVATVEEILNLVSGFDTKREKVRAVYRYMQKHTRYVNVSLGIGGYQPYPASYVDEKGYGDCKALSNYTLALLRAAGIEARYTLVHAGAKAGKVLKDFPSNQFNHVILCVPDGQDSIWLECTSQEQPFDFLGSFTNNREALMITGGGGVLVHTPEYRMEQNVLVRKAGVSLSEAGDATATIFTRYSGLQIEHAQDALLLKGEDLKKRYYDKLDVSDLDIRKIQLEQTTENDVPEIHEHLQITMRKYMSKGGKRVFLPLNLMNRTSRIPKQIDERESDLVLMFPYIDIDSIVYTIPESLEVEYTPSDVSLTTEFGTYQSSVKVKEQQITYVRKVTMKKGRYPREMFAEFASLRKQIVKADNGKVLLKQTQLASKSAP